ncbi:MAG TPA: hypothetical protein VFA41_09375 [Ktedonobacteraceae bacterium]|jgi:hypothetical protein|nr:hypothetical protein [Ktedonobacteraceae bacterium]
MQRVTFSKVISSIYSATSDEEIVHFVLEDLLAAGQTLALNVPLGTLSLIEFHPDMSYPRLAGEQQFTTSEMNLVLPLLHSYPHYCPYEVLLASFNYSKLSEALIEKARKHLHAALEEGIWDQEMRPVRNVLSRARLKLRNLGIDIVSILETGYVLMRLSERKLMNA